MGESGKTVQADPAIEVPTFVFLGVSTSQSSVHHYFARWCEVLGATWRLRGVDLQIGSTAAKYEDFLAKEMSRTTVVGALVTSHKAALFEHCRSRFDHLTSDARTLEEVGAIFAHRSGWAADAPDVRSTEGVISRLFASPQWLDGARHAVIFGAGGAGLALAISLASKNLNRITLTERSAPRLRAVERILSHADESGIVHLCDAAANQLLMDGSPPGTLFVNASGLGKDQPGSPVGSFENAPHGAIAWDFNYRGELKFLEQARTCTFAKKMILEDGWAYFISGWAHTMSRVLGVTCTNEIVQKFQDVVPPRVHAPTSR